MLNWLVAGIGDISTKRVIPAIQSEGRSVLHAVLTDLMKSKPASSKGIFLQKVSLSSTMGVGVLVDQSTLPV